MGHIHTQETKIKLRNLKLGRNNPAWKEDGVSYSGLHHWVNLYIKKPKICEECGSIKNIDLANITGIYTRDFHNWAYLCRKCHMKSDNRGNKLAEKGIENLKKLSEKSRKKVAQFDLEGNLIKEFISLSEAAREIKGSSGNICCVANGKYNTAYGFIWKYI